MTSFKTGDAQIIPLRERNLAPRHEDDKMLALMKQAFKEVNEERDRTLLKEMRNLTERVALGFERLSESIEAYTSGEQDVAVACMVDSPTDDLPALSRLKAESSLVYTLSATDIARQIGIKVADTSFLLSQVNGLDWIHRKPLLWNHGVFTKTKRRFWHPKTVELLLQVVNDRNHPEREGISAACERILERASAR